MGRKGGRKNEGKYIKKRDRDDEEREEKSIWEVGRDEDHGREKGKERVEKKSRER